MRRIAALAVAGLLLVLTACTGLPTSGSVNPGNLPRQAEDAPAFNLVPDPPRAGSTPEQIVDGFLQAGVGAQNNWQTAREYLTPEYAPNWVPLKQVTIDRLAERSTAVATPTPSPAAEELTSIEVTQRITAEAQVSAVGEYSPLAGGPQALPFHLVQRDGEWRIDRAPDGIVLNQEVFPSVFTAASLMYFDPTYSSLVPDVRWFPRNLIAARVTQALVDGPTASWLEPAVVSAFPDNVSLASNVVALADGGTTAQVELSSSAFALEDLTLNRMQTQLEKSLESTGIANVQMMVNTTPLDAEAVPVRPDRVNIRPLVETTDGEFGFLDADSVEAIPGLSPAVEDTDAAAVVLAADRRTAAVLNSDGAVLRAYADGSTNVLDGSTPGLLAPSIDTVGAVWTMAENVPTSFVVYPLEGPAVTISPAWPLASRVFAFQISRDGTRIAALVRANERTEIWVSAITREESLPAAVGEPLVLATTPSQGIGIAWQDDENLGVLLDSPQGPTVLVQPVGGRGALVAVPSDDAVEISGGNSSARVRTADGILLIRRGENWEEGAADIAVLGVQQGQPE